MVEGEDIIVAFVSQVNMVTNEKNWVLNSGATRHIYANKEFFSTYKPFKDGEEVVNLGDSRIVNVFGKYKVLLKLTLGKTLALNEVLHVPNIRANLVSIALLGKFGIKVSIEFDKIVMTKNNVFWGERYCNHGLFGLDVDNEMNKNPSSFAYLLDFIGLWHARLEHVSLSYLKKLNSLGFISILNSSSMNKHEICVEAKITMKR